MTSSVFLTQSFCQMWHYTETEDFVSLAEDIECDCMAGCRKKYHRQNLCACRDYNDNDPWW